MKTSIIIATRNEPDLNNTVKNLKENNPDFEIVVMEDEQGLGCQQMRHRGIMKATGDVCILMDGHMRVKGPDDLCIMSEAGKGNDLACAQCFHSGEISFEGNPYMGARIIWKAKEGSEQWALPAKWRTERSTGEIGAVMGACYAFNRERYIDHLGMPFKLGYGWGSDEETLSITNWLGGGNTILTEAQVWHQYRTEKNPQPFIITAKQAAGVWWNRLKLLDMITMSHENKIELFLWLASSCKYQIEKYIRKWISENDIELTEFREKLNKTSARTFEGWKALWLNREKKMTTNEMRKLVNELPLPDYKWKDIIKMKKQQLEKILAELEVPLVKPTEPESLYTRCLHCQNTKDIVKKHTYPNGNQLIFCPKCMKHSTLYTNKVN